MSLLRNSIVYVVLGFLAPAINFLLLPLYTRYLAPEDYALITLATLFQSVVTIFIGPGQPGSIGRIIFDHIHDKDEVHQLFSTAIINTIFTGGMIFLLFLGIGDFVFRLAFKNNVFTFEKYGIFTLVYALIYNLQGIILTHYRNIEDVKKFVLWSVLFLLFSVGGIFTGVVILQWKAYGNISGRMIGLSIPILMYLLYYYSRHKPYYSFKLDKSMLVYGLPLIPYSLTLFLNNNLDSLFIERYLNLKLLGIFSMAVAISNIMEIFFNSVNNAINPTIFKLLLDQDNETNIRKIKGYYINYILFTIIIILLCSICTGYIILLVIDDIYFPILYLLPILFVSYIARVNSSIFGIPLFFFKKTNILPIISIFTLIIGVAYDLFIIPKYAILGAAFSPLLMKESRVWLYIFFSSKYKLLDKSCYSLKKELYISYCITLIISIFCIISYNQEFLHFQLQLSLICILLIFTIIFIYRKYLYENVYSSFIKK